MYATCLFCHADLGRNEAIETFPVGRRLAFDAAKGRLWVVCRVCERWNLTPLEERWEAIEAAERLFRDTRLRVSTDNVGLARLREGTELVRIGEPQRPEFAAWRYGDQFGRRRTRQLLVAGAGVAAIGGVVAGGMAAGMSIAGFWWILTRAGTVLVKGHPGSEVVRAAAVPGAAPLRVLRGHLAETSIGTDHAGQLTLDLRHAGGRVFLEGVAATRMTARLVPHANRFGGGRSAVQTAVRAIEEGGGSERYVNQLALRSRAATRPPEKSTEKWTWASDIPAHGLFGLATEQRLALEMALHEESERRAMDGELAALERDWRDAEEIAAIADDLLLPEGLDERLAALRRSSDTDAAH